MDREPLADPKTATVVAVLFGASEFPSADGLSASPAFAGAASAFREYLKSERGFHLSDEQVLDLFDSDASVIEQNDRLTEHLERHLNATDLIIYYVGHGGFLSDREYFLALRSTKRGAEGYTGLRIRALAQSLEESFPDKRVFLILDCCFAGEAVAQFQSGELATIVESKTFDALPEFGTSLLVAASKDEPAIAPIGAASTMFSECLLDVLGTGVADARRALSLAEVGEIVQKRVRSRFGLRAVRPEVHSPRQGGGDVAKLPLFPNPAYVPPKPAALPEEIDDALRNPIADVRRGAIGSLEQFLAGADARRAALARAELERLAAEDDSLSVRERARRALEWPAEPIAPAEDKDESQAPGGESAHAPAPAGGGAARRNKALIAAGVATLVLGAASWWTFLGPESDSKPAPPRAQGQSLEGERAARADVDARVEGNGEAMPGTGDREQVEEDPRRTRATAPETLEPPAASEGVESGSASTGPAAQPQPDPAGEIRRLLARAETDLENDRLTTPSGNNAAERYRAVLALDGDNAAARAGLERVVDRYVELANAAIADERLERAESYVARARGLAPQRPDVAILGARIDARRAAQREHAEIERLLAQAGRDLRQGRLAAPRGDNAVERYRAVLERDPGNRAALAGIDRVAERFLEQAARALDDGDLAGAGDYLARAQSAAPNHRALAGFRERLSEAAESPSELAFAVFPFESQSVCFYPVRDEVTDAADAVVSRQPRAKIAYSYYAAGADAGRIPKTRELWSENVARREPELDIVRKAGRGLGVNGVLMTWYTCSHTQHVPADSYEVEVYLIDVNRDRVYHAKEDFLDANRAISDVFERFFSAYDMDPA